jgi:predicted nucleic acid-binding protein
MNGKRFLDSNLLIYAFDSSEPTKQLIAQERIAELAAASAAVFSTQVLGEFFHVLVVRKRAMTADEAETAINAFLATMLVTPIEPHLVTAAIGIHRRFQTRYWDSLIIAAARQQGLC